MAKKIFKIIGWIILAIAVVFIVAWQFDYSAPQGPILGMTFSEYYAKENLKLDWQKAYEALLKDLNFPKLRLVAYWEYLEPTPGKLDFKDLDWQVQKAEEAGRKVTLAIGYRVPRWPECHEPDWVKKLGQTDFQNSLSDYLTQIVNHYKNSPAIETWQVENEPFLSTFGECPPPNAGLLQKEIALVKSLDSTRPVMVTDTGELSLWLQSSRYGDILGTTLYRIVWAPIWGEFHHFLPPAFYTWRAWLSKTFTGKKDIVVAELQAEPWPANNLGLADVPFDRQTDTFNLNDMKNTLDFAKKTGLDEVFLWGPEWWYYREIHGDPSWMDFGKSLK